MKITWTNERRKVAKLIPADYNPRMLNDKDRRDLEQSIKKFDAVEPIVVNIGERNDILIGGHQRVTIYADLGIDEIDVRVPNRELTIEEETELNLRLNRLESLIKKCLICNKYFVAKKDCKTRNQIFCSIKCCGKSKIGKQLTKNQLKSLELGRGWNKGMTGIGGWEWSIKSKKKLSETKKGKKFSAKHKEALSKVKKGKSIKHLIENQNYISKKISKALKGKPQPWNRGKNHHNWQGGITHLNFQIRNSLEYKSWRREVFVRDDFTCQNCGVRSKNITVHHIKSFSQYSLFSELSQTLNLISSSVLVESSRSL